MRWKTRWQMGYNKDEISSLPTVSGIYRIYNIQTLKSYIGQAQDIQKRVYQHWHPYSKNIQKIEKAMMQAPEDFLAETLELCGTSSLNERECFWIEKYNSYKNGYNLTKGGTLWRGENHPKAKLTACQVEKIKEMLIQQKSATETLAETDFPVTLCAISSINTGRSWKDDSLQYPLSYLSGVRKITEAQACTIREKYFFREEGFTVSALSKQYDLSDSEIRAILCGKCFANAGGPIITSKQQTKNFSSEEVVLWRKRAQNNETIKNLWKTFLEETGREVSYDVFKNMISGRTYKNIEVPRRSTRLEKKEEKYLNILSTMKKNPSLSKKEIAKLCSCGERTVYRAIEWWSNEL